MGDEDGSREFFDHVDKDKDGKVTVDEIIATMVHDEEEHGEIADEHQEQHKSDMEKYHATARKVFPKADVDKDGHLTFTEFQKLSVLMQETFQADYNPDKKKNEL